MEIVKDTLFHDRFALDFGKVLGIILHVPKEKDYIEVSMFLDGLPVPLWKEFSKDEAGQSEAYTLLAKYKEWMEGQDG